MKLEANSRSLYQKSSGGKLSSLYESLPYSLYQLKHLEVQLEYNKLKTFDVLLMHF